MEGWCCCPCCCAAIKEEVVVPRRRLPCSGKDVDPLSILSWSWRRSFWRIASRLLPLKSCCCCCCRCRCNSSASNADSALLPGPVADAGTESEEITWGRLLACLAFIMILATSTSSRLGDDGVSPGVEAGGEGVADCFSMTLLMLLGIVVLVVWDFPAVWLVLGFRQSHSKPMVLSLSIRSAVMLVAFPSL